jgi:hypothetical protein
MNRYHLSHTGPVAVIWFASLYFVGQLLRGWFL